MAVDEFTSISILTLFLLLTYHRTFYLLKMLIYHYYTPFETIYKIISYINVYLYYIYPFNKIAIIFYSQSFFKTKNKNI